MKKDFLNHKNNKITKFNFETLSKKKTGFQNRIFRSQDRLEDQNPMGSKVKFFR